MAEGNSVFDEIRAQNRKMKGKPFKEQFAYFWEYYKIPTLVTIVVIAVAANLIYSMVTAKDSVMSALWVNCYTEMDATAYMEGFTKYLGVDTKEYETTLETNFTLDDESMDQYSMASIQKFAALVAAGQLDVVVSDRETFLEYAVSGYFHNLNQILSPEQLEKYGDNLIYCDIAEEEGEEDLGEIPVGIRISDCAALREAQAYTPDRDACFGIIINSSHIENAVSYLEYMYLEGAVPPIG